MIVRFGYVAMSATLKDCSPSKTITAANLAKIEQEKMRFARLAAIARENLKNTQRLFYHNKGHDIQVFRLTSRLIPLATHPLAENWDWFNDVQGQLKSLGDYAREHHFRLSAHPDHFTLLNSPKEDVTRASIRDLEYHLRIFEGMGLKSSSKLVMHVGGSYRSKEESIQRFIKNYLGLSSELKSRIILENDDKIYTARDVLKLCQELSLPMVVDIHHHWCNHQGENLIDLLPEIFSTWQNQPHPPKIHVSSPKSPKDFRSHADYVEPDFFLAFLNQAAKLNQDFDVMIEAKQKDGALFRLMKDLQKVPYIRSISEASIAVQP